MGQRILILQGHPDPAGGHLCHALGDAYAKGAQAAGRNVRVAQIASLGLPLVQSPSDWMSGETPLAAKAVQADILWADHLVLIYPLWVGTMPAVVKGFIEQVFRQGFAFGDPPSPFAKPLKGRSARVVVTMGMPALFYRWYYGAHSLKSLERNALRFVGFGPVRDTVIGMAGEVKPQRAKKIFARMQSLGAKGV